MKKQKTESDKGEEKSSLLEKETSERKEEKLSCADKQCPFHGELRLRGRSFKGNVIRKLPRIICIEFERTIYVIKYERYMKKKTKIHARLPDCLKDEINIGDYIEVRECRPLSKITHFCVVRKLRSNLQFSSAQKSEAEKISDIKKIRSKEERK